MKIEKFSLKFNKILLLVLAMFLIIPTTSFAASNKTVCNITYANGTYYGGGASATGTEDNPVSLSLNYDEIVVSFGSNAASTKFEFPFCFKLVDGGSGMKYGKYQVTVLEEEKKVIFKRLAASNSMDSFLVTPNKKEEGYNYAQPGAVYNDNFSNMGFRPPFYKIECTLKFGGNKKIETVLGNSTLNENNSGAANQASNSQVYVFCVSGLSESQTIKFSSGQSSNSATVVVKETETGLIFDDDDVKKYLVQGTNTIKDITSGGTTYTFSGSTAEVIYSFWGITSEILNDNETSSIEEVIAKVLISLGSIFRAIVTAVGGPDLTIDALIFNQYDDTILDFWGGKGTYVDLFTSVINGWFGAFRAIAAFMLVIILVAMGVKAILLAGTPNQKKIQGMFAGWVIAVGLLYLGPYFLKYAIVMNDTFVDALRSASKYSIYSVYNTDFLNKYDLETNMQLAEDSETVKVEDTLMKLYSQIEDDLETTTAELEDAERRIQNFNNNFILDLFYKDTRVVEVKASGREISRTISRAKSVIEARIRAGENVDEEYINTLIGEVATRVDNAPFGENTVKDALLDYAQAYAKKQELENDLEATEKAIALANKGIDLESTMKSRAGETYRVVYVLVWYIMIYQLVVLLVVYYKRLVFVGVLIVIYPLAVMVYAIEKLMGIDKPKSFSTWLKEYLVNVFIQTIHALVYIMLVEAGLRVYEDDEDNWLLFLFAVLAIFPMEGIVKAIIGMKAKSAEDKDRLNLKKMLGYGIAISGVRKIVSSGAQVEARYNAEEAARQKKYANQDKNREFGRVVADKYTMRQGEKHGKIDEAKAQIAERNKQRAKADEERAKKRAAAKKNRERRMQIAKKVQVARNAAAVADAITTAGAMGFDASDFKVGFSTAGVITGKSRNYKAKKRAPTVSDPRGDSQRASYAEDMAARRNKYAEEKAGSSIPSTSTSTPNSQEPQEVPNNPIVQNAPAQHNNGGSSPIQDQIRQNLGIDMSDGKRENDVNVDNPNYTFTEHEE